MHVDSPLALSLLLLGCSAAHEASPPDAAPSEVTPADAGAPNPCPAGWVPEPGACARWTAAAPYPAERCDPGTVPEPAISLYGSPMVRCGEVGFVYRALSDDWAEEPGGTFRADDWAETLSSRPNDEQRRVAPLWGDRLLLLHRRAESDPWSATRVSFRGDDTQPTAAPPIDPVALLPMGSAQAIAAGSERSAVYERIVR